MNRRNGLLWLNEWFIIEGGSDKYERGPIKNDCSIYDRT